MMRILSQSRSSFGGLDQLGDAATKLDKLRYQDPHAVLEKISSSLDSCKDRERVELLGVAASAFRMVLRLSHAKGCLREGLAEADKVDDDFLRGNLIQRLAYIVSDEGSYELAWRLASRSAIYYEHFGDRSAAATTFVDKGMFLYYLKKRNAALKCWQTALRLLPKRDEMNRFAAHQAIGIALARRGELKEAQHHLQEAFSELKDMTRIGPYALAAILRLDGRIHGSLGQFANACHSLSQSFKMYSKTSAGQAALVGVELIQMQIRSGLLSQAQGTVVELRRIACSLSENEGVCSTLLELCYASELTAELASCAARNLKGKLEDHLQLALRVPNQPFGSTNGPSRTD